MFSAVSLKDLKISVPEAVASGDTVVISCHYDLENVSEMNLITIIETNNLYFRYNQNRPLYIQCVGISIKRNFIDMYRKNLHRLVYSQHLVLLSM